MRSFRVLALALLGTAVLAASASAQQRRVSGRVAGPAGEPLSGATVLVVGTTAGTNTDEQGRFALAVPAGDVSLLVRRLGYKRATVRVPAAQSEVNVTLERDVLQLEAQVVTGVATTISKKNAANDIPVVSAQDLERVPAPSVENALAGKIAGAQVIQNSGAPGGGNQIRMRGVTSVFANANPLYVVDGVIVSDQTIQTGLNAVSQAAGGNGPSNQDNGVNRIADLNPNDIESIEVLKGASASAIYGSKASNGVIIIKTKTGSSGRTRFNFTQRIGTYAIENKIEPLRFDINAAPGAKNNPFDYIGASTAADSQFVRDNYNSCGGYCDMEQQLFGEHPLSYESNLSASGGTDRTRYFVSGLAKHDGGIEKNTGYDKQSIRLNLNQLVGSRLTLDVNSNLIHTITKRGVSNNDNTNITPYFVIAETPSWYDQRAKGGSYEPNPFTGGQFGANMFQTRDLLQTPEEVFRAIGSISGTYTAYTSQQQNLSIKLDAGVDQFGYHNRVVSPATLFFEPGDGLPGTNVDQNGTSTYANANLAVTHTYNPASGLFSATTAAGVQREIRNLATNAAIGRNCIVGQENVNRCTAVDAIPDREQSRELALFAQEELLTLNERLTLTGGLRAERSTRNGDVNKYYVYPKGAIAYRVPAFSVFDEFKLRLAVGKAGNQAPANFKFSPAVASVYSGFNALQIGAFRGAADIRPEIQTEVEGGIDMAMLDQRVSLSLTGYQKTVNDVVLLVTTPPSLGYSQLVLNAGQFRNRGIEAALNAQVLQIGRFNWVNHTTYARNVGIVTKLPVPQYTVPNNFGAGFGEGLLQEGQSITQIVGTDPNGNLAKYGDAAPAFTMGFGNELNFGPVRLYGLVDWSYGNSLVNITGFLFDALGTNPDTIQASRRLGQFSDGYAPYIEHASYAKLRELSLGYQVPQAWVNRLFGPQATTARVEFTGRNLLTWTNYSGIDPEVSNFGSQQISRFIDIAPYPPSRSFFLSINLGF